MHWVGDLPRFAIPLVGVASHWMMEEHVDEHPDVGEVVQSVRHSEVVVIEQSEDDSDCEAGSPGPGGGPGGTGTGGGSRPLQPRHGMQFMPHMPPHQMSQWWPQLLLHVGPGFPEETITVGLFLVAKLVCWG
jgi:hypothetical protein